MAFFNDCFKFFLERLQKWREEQARKEAILAKQREDQKRGEEIFITKFASEDICIDFLILDFAFFHRFHLSIQLLSFLEVIGMRVKV